MIEINNVSKKYDKFTALENINLTIKAGSIFGLIGINGAGKTTLLRILSGVFQPDTGYILFNGEKLLDNESLKSNIYFIPDDPFYTPLMKGKEIASLYKTMYDFDEEQFEHYINMFNLNLNLRIKSYSKGMRRRLYVAIGMALRPKYFFIDEVFDGLDPQARIQFKKGMIELIEKYNSTIVVASHSLRELEEICDSYALIDGKQIASTGSVAESVGDMFKFSIAFDRNISKADIPFECVSFETSGRIIQIIVRGQKEQILSEIKKLNPIIVDEMSVNFEELFLSKTDGGFRL